MGQSMLRLLENASLRPAFASLSLRLKFLFSSDGEYVTKQQR
jgi:hypothetical protein